MKVHAWKDSESVLLEQEKSSTRVYSYRTTSFLGRPRDSRRRSLEQLEWRLAREPEGQHIPLWVGFKAEGVKELLGFVLRVYGLRLSISGGMVERIQGVDHY
jgi:hypothetical protein